MTRLNETERSVALALAIMLLGGSAGPALALGLKMPSFKFGKKSHPEAEGKAESDSAAQAESADGAGSADGAEGAAKTKDMPEEDEVKRPTSRRPSTKAAPDELDEADGEIVQPVKRKRAAPAAEAEDRDSAEGNAVSRRRSRKEDSAEKEGSEKDSSEKDSAQKDNKDKAAREGSEEVDSAANAGKSEEGAEKSADKSKTDKDGKPVKKSRDEMDEAELLEESEYKDEQEKKKKAAMLKEITAPGLPPEQRDPEPHLRKAQVLTKAGSFKEALLEINKALSLKPQYWEAYYQGALILQLSGRNKEAIERYKYLISRIWSFI